MNQLEQEIVHDLVANATTVDFSALQFEVTPETSEDVQWVWRTFGLKPPAEAQIRGLPEGLQNTLRSLSPKLQADS